MSGYITKKKDMRFQSVEALQQVVNVVNEAAAALDDPKRTIRESAIPEVLAGAFGAGIGGAASFAALYGLGTVGTVSGGHYLGAGNGWGRCRRRYGCRCFCAGCTCCTFGGGWCRPDGTLEKQTAAPGKREAVSRGAQKASGDYKSAESGTECQQGTPGVFGELEYFAEPGHS